jgi:hypothetical protein
VPAQRVQAIKEPPNRQKHERSQYQLTDVDDYPQFHLISYVLIRAVPTGHGVKQDHYGPDERPCKEENAVKAHLR